MNKIVFILIAALFTNGCVNDLSRSNPLDPNGGAVGSDPGTSTKTLTLSSPLSGTYSGNNYRLIAANSPYLVSGDVTLGNFANDITIEAGVTVKFPASQNFNIDPRNFYAQGTSSKPIKFISGRASPAPGDYPGVFINYPTGNSVLMDYVYFQHGVNQLVVGATNTNISNCVFSNNSNPADIRVSANITNCNFESIWIGGGYAPSFSYCNISGTIIGQSTAGQYSVNNCNLTKGSAVIFQNSANWSLDAANNWWGTSNSATIASYIFSTSGTINYTPFLSSSVLTAGPQ